MIRTLLVVVLAAATASHAQYVQTGRAVQQSAQPVQAVQQQQQSEAIDQIPAWYQMAKPAAGRVQSVPQASPSYYERHEPTYEQRRAEQQPTYERPGIQTNQYANYPSYQNRQPYENLNALTAGASLSNLQANRRYPSAASVSGGSSDVSRSRHVHLPHSAPPSQSPPPPPQPHPSPASYTRTQHHHPGRVVWYTSPRGNRVYNVVHTTPPPSVDDEVRGVKRLLAMTPYAQTRDQFARWYDQMKAFYYFNQLVDWRTFKTMFLNRH